ncbi:alpha/beta fold hydrolase [Aspergillus mulundensis]|uniref:AB hydrolase-1 domain-containing protein n=1 Tax=Aspergillus mulundensis TaxID=1810919 RepID=A0A3D8T2E5_9EURO|nr:hypothetical protein DSM5745_00057 [Aspergillus mulundensis]RDW92735.1 hypothetical protein DSM5745_00057 [Aspergillus mulundensis]
MSLHLHSSHFKPPTPTPPTPIPLHHEIHGSGPLLLLIPGGHGTSLLFSSLAKHLASHFRVVTYDRRGYHRSSSLPHPQPGTAIATHAADLAALIRHVRATPTEKAIVFGSSWAGYIAITLLASSPSLVSRVLVHEPVFLSVLPDKTQSSLRCQIQGMLETYKERGTAAANRLLMPALSSAGDREEFVKSDAYAGVATQPHCFGAWFETEFGEALTFRVPLDGLARADCGAKLVLLRGDDADAPVFSTSPVVRLSGLLGIPCGIVPGGHMGYVTRQKDFADALTGILEGANEKQAGAGTVVTARL